MSAKSRRLYLREWKAKNPGKQKLYESRRTPEQLKRRREYSRQWQIRNPSRCAAWSKKWRDKNPARSNAVTKRYRDANPEKVRAFGRNWRNKNRAHVNAHERERCATDPAHRLSRRLRNRVYQALHGKASKSDRTRKLIGCDVQFLMGYLEARFKPGMSWKNYGTVWEIDHRIPVSSYDLTDASHQRSCFHYSNLQPLFCGENKRKSDTPPPTHQAELL